MPRELQCLAIMLAMLPAAAGATEQRREHDPARPAKQQTASNDLNAVTRQALGRPAIARGHLAQPTSVATPPLAESRRVQQSVTVGTSSASPAAGEASGGEAVTGLSADRSSGGAFPAFSPRDPARNESDRRDPQVPGGTRSLIAMVSSLATVVGLFLVLAWLTKRASGKGSRQLPGDVVEVLGRAPLAGRQQMHLLRCGSKLLLVSVTPDTTETLTEITDPDEVAHLISLCREGQPGSASAAFGQLLEQFGRQPAGARFAGPTEATRTASRYSSTTAKLGRTYG